MRSEAVRLIAFRVRLDRPSISDIFILEICFSLEITTYLSSADSTILIIPIGARFTHPYT